MPRTNSKPTAWETDRERISRCLKAARWIAGTGHRSAKGQLAPLPAQALADRPQLTANIITASRIEEIEQMQVDARPMELERIAVALGQPAHYFLDEPVSEELGTRQLSRRLATVEQNQLEMMAIGETVTALLQLLVPDEQTLVAESLLDQLNVARELARGSVEAGEGPATKESSG